MTAAVPRSGWRHSIRPRRPGESAAAITCIFRTALQQSLRQILQRLKSDGLGRPAFDRSQRAEAHPLATRERYPELSTFRSFLRSPRLRPNYTAYAIDAAGRRSACRKTRSSRIASWMLQLIARRPPPPSPLPQPALTHAETRRIVFGVLLPVFLGSLDATILASALPTIGRDLGDVHLLPWLITAYLIASTAVTPLFGKISDIRGRRRNVAGCHRNLHRRLAHLRALAEPAGADLRPRHPRHWRRRSHRDGHGRCSAISPRPRIAAATMRISPRPTPPPGPAARRSAGSSPTTCTGRRSSGSNSAGTLALALTSSRLRRLPRHDRPHRLDVLGAALIVVASVAFMLALTLGGARYPWASPPILTLLGLALAHRRRVRPAPSAGDRAADPDRDPVRPGGALRACGQHFRLGADRGAQHIHADVPAKRARHVADLRGAQPDGDHGNAQHQRRRHRPGARARSSTTSGCPWSAC